MRTPTRFSPARAALDSEAEPPREHPDPPSISRLAGYFLRLGALGFGGPIALAANMRRDLVDERQWILPQDYAEGLAFAQLSPGPLAAQLAMYLGWARGGIRGATVTGLAFVLPSFVMVAALAALYVHYGELPWIHGVFYGIGAAVIAIIARSAYKLARSTLKTDGLLWILCAVVALLTAWTQSESIVVFVACGVIAVAVKARPPAPSSAAGLLVGFGWLLRGEHGMASAATTTALGGFFLKAGAFVFGSGLAIVPFLYGGVVREHHWLTEQQFLDAVAVAMITPGPVVITAGFIGYLVAGPVGAVVAALAVFAPPYLIVVFAAPHYRRFAKNRQVQAFVQGVTAAAIGAIVGAAFVLATRSIVDWPTATIATVTFAVLAWRRIPEPFVILGAGAAGLALFTHR
jgi:chromate transporter